MKTGQLTRANKAKLVAGYLTKKYPPVPSFLRYSKDFELLFAVILSAQATDKSVNEATDFLFSRYPTLEDFTEENRVGILSCISHVGLGKSKTGYRIQTAKILLERYGGKVPNDRKALMELPGVGYKTSGVVLAELYDYPYIPVDTHVYRVSHRIGRVKDELSPEKTERELERLLKDYHAIDRHHDFILFGRETCLSRNPKCSICPFAEFCDEFRKKQKTQKSSQNIRHIAKKSEKNKKY